MKFLRFLSRARQVNARALRIDSTEALLKAIAAFDDRAGLRIEVPMSLTATEGAFAFAAGWHPFVEAIRSGPGVLEQFYGQFQPKSLGQFYALDMDGLGQLGPRHLPWLEPPRAYRGEKGLGPQHGISLFGPCSKQEIELEYARLTETSVSIESHGFLPDRFGDITGYCLLGDDAFRFVVRGGKHRAAALAAKGRTHLPIRFKSGWARSVRLDGIAAWPMVQNGRIAAEPAQCVFERFFQFNGTQQQSWCEAR